MSVLELHFFNKKNLRVYVQPYLFLCLQVSTTLKGVVELWACLVKLFMDSTPLNRSRFPFFNQNELKARTVARSRRLKEPYQIHAIARDGCVAMGRLGKANVVPCLCQRQQGLWKKTGTMILHD